MRSGWWLVNNWMTYRCFIPYLFVIRKVLGEKRGDSLRQVLLHVVFSKKELKKNPSIHCHLFQSWKDEMLYQQGLYERLTKKATKGCEFRGSLNHYGNRTSGHNFPQDFDTKPVFFVGFLPFSLMPTPCQRVFFWFWFGNLVMITKRMYKTRDLKSEIHFQPP